MSDRNPYSLADRQWMEGRRCQWDGHTWAVVHWDDDNVLMLIRATIPMSKYDTEWVHISKVNFEVPA